MKESDNLGDCITFYLFITLYCYKVTVKCLSIGTPKNNKISICSKSKIDYF